MKHIPCERVFAGWVFLFAASVAVLCITSWIFRFRWCGLMGFNTTKHAACISGIPLASIYEILLKLILYDIKQQHTYIWKLWGLHCCNMRWSQVIQKILQNISKLYIYIYIFTQAKDHSHRTDLQTFKHITFNAFYKDVKSLISSEHLQTL